MELISKLPAIKADEFSLELTKNVDPEILDRLNLIHNGIDKNTKTLFLFPINKIN